MTTYYILEQGQKKGPFSLQELKKKNIQPTTYIWRLGMNNWTEAQEMPELSDLLQEIPPPVPPMPSSFLIQSILATIFCCFPLGIAGIINALKVSEAYRMGNYTEAKDYSESADEWCGIAFGTWLVIFLLVITIILIIHFSNFAYSNKAFLSKLI